MPQRQLPIFPAGVTEINNSIAVQKEAGQVVYIHGHLPVFHHEEEDIGSFRMFTSQMIVNGTVKPKEIVKAFGVPVITVKRYVKVFRDQGAKGFYETKARQSSASASRPRRGNETLTTMHRGGSDPRAGPVPTSDAPPVLTVRQTSTRAKSSPWCRAQQRAALPKTPRRPMALTGLEERAGQAQRPWPPFMLRLRRECKIAPVRDDRPAALR